MQTLLYLIGFLVICLASHRIGQLFSRIKLPYITGYLFAGALVASFGLDFIPSDAADRLRFIDEMSLAVIAFVAGSELYLKDLRNRLRRIVSTASGILVVALVFGGVTIYLLTDVIPFTQGMATPSRIAVALLGSTVLLALSPPSTIAVIKEVRARGPFTSTALGVTVLMDVVIIVLFAVSTSIASALLLGVSFSIGFVGVLALDLVLALLIGYGVGKGLQALLGTGWPKGLKTAVIVGVGWGIFALAGQVKVLSAAHLPFEIYIEPLLIALVGGFLVTNFTSFRAEFDEILHDIGPAVYVAFFTLTGISLKLDILWAVLPVALALFAVRAVSIFIGAYAGGALSGVPGRINRISWMAFITQAGIALGLAREVAVQFPPLGDAFATLIISVVVLNEIFGPLFLKAVLRRVGEAHLPETGPSEETREALILGVESQSMALARLLRAHDWEVTLADTDAEHLRQVETNGWPTRHLPDLTAEHLDALISPRTHAVVALLGDDAENLQVCRLAYERFGIPRIVARVRDLSLAPRFRDLGAFVIDTATALVTLIDQAVRTPQSAALVLHQNGGREIAQITVSNTDVDGLLVRDLRLPEDVLLLDIARGGSSVVPHGNSPLRLRDEVTLVGSQESLDDVTLRLGY
ncbi:MAG: potassium transporter TrkA [Bacteroidetes bacterium]|jgi:Trk K+ transport system NAD-binding subunit/Kef-type K+ transport system membrane component KefB|nr:potassium transporter TrkA [Bacteroidota bacterium]